MNKINKDRINISRISSMAEDMYEQHIHLDDGMRAAIEEMSQDMYDDYDATRKFNKKPVIELDESSLTNFADTIVTESGWRLGAEDREILIRADVL